MEVNDDELLPERKGKEKVSLNVLNKIKPVVWYISIIDRYPKISFCSCFTTLIFLSLVLGALLFLGAFELSPDALLEDREDRAYISFNAYKIAQRESVNEFSNNLRDNSRIYYPLTLIFESKHDSQVFKQSNIEEMKEIQNHILSRDKYSDYCFRGASSNSCEDPITVLNYFYPQILPNGTVIYNGKGDKIVTNINGVLSLMREGKGVFQYADFFVEDDFDDDLESSITRIVFNFAMPFDNKDLADDEDFIKMKDEIYEFQQDLEDYLSNASTNNMRVLYLGSGLTFTEIQRYLYFDLGLAIISIILVYCFMIYQTGSYWISILGMFQIISAFPCAILTYYYIFNIPYFGAIHLLGVFIVLGIGADDTFIFIDTFKISRKLHMNKKERLIWSYKRAGKAMFVTSITTISALIITALVTPFVALQTFGIFAALLVFYDFVLVMSFFPTAVYLYSKWFEYKSLYCCVNNSLFSFIPLLKNKNWNNWRDKNSCIRCITCQSADYKVIQNMYKDNDNSEEDNEEKDNKNDNRILTAVLLDFYKTFMFHKWRRYIVLCYFIFFLIIVIIGASFTQPADEAVEFVSTGTNFGDAIELQEDFKQNPGELLQVTIVWGLDGLDQTSGDRYDELLVGDVEYDEDFDPSSEAAQTLVLNVCNGAKDYDNDMKIETDGSADSTVKCYQTDFITWMQSEYPGVNLPVTGSLYVQYLREFINSDEYYEKYNDMIGFVDNRLSFVSVAFNTTQDTDKSYQDGFSHRDAWWDYIDNINDDAPGSMKSASGVCSIWAWWRVQQLLFEQALIGMAISLFVAFMCVTIFTMNIIVSFFTILAITSVVATVLCLLVVFGWNLGAMEAIASIMVVGLSVDYSVHLSHAYVECKSKTRWKRITFAINAVGLSILSGGITTMLAACVLSVAVIVFLQRFGILILCIIFFSSFYSFGFLMSLLSIFGPENNIGNIGIIIQPIVKRIIKLLDTILFSILVRLGVMKHFEN